MFAVCALDLIGVRSLKDRHRRIRLVRNVRAQRGEFTPQSAVNALLNDERGEKAGSDEGSYNQSISYCAHSNVVTSGLSKSRQRPKKQNGRLRGQLCAVKSSCRSIEIAAGAVAWVTVREQADRIVAC